MGYRTLVVHPWPPFLFSLFFERTLQLGDRQIMGRWDVVPHGP